MNNGHATVTAVKSSAFPPGVFDGNHAQPFSEDVYVARDAVQIVTRAAVTMLFAASPLGIVVLPPLMFPTLS